MQCLEQLFPNQPVLVVNLLTSLVNPPTHNQPPPLTVEVDGDSVGLLLFDLASWHAVLHSALEHGVLVSLGGLHVQGALDSEETGGLLYHRGDHVGL